MGDDTRNPRWMLYDPDRQHFPGLKGALLSDLEAAEAARDSAEARAAEAAKDRDRAEQKAKDYAGLAERRTRAADEQYAHARDARAQRDRLAAEREEALDVLEQVYDCGMGESSVAVENLLVKVGRIHD